MKILVISVHNSYDNRITKHITSLINNDYEVKYLNVTNDSFEPDYKEKIDYEKINKLCYPRKKTITYLFILFSLFIKVLKTKADVMHIHDNLLLPLVLVGKIKKMKIVYDKHEFFENASKLHKLFEIMYSKYIDFYVLVTEQQIDFLQQVKHNLRYEIVPNYQSINFYNNIEIENLKLFTITYIGSLDEKDRDVESMLYIFEKILNCNRNVRVVFGGVNPSDKTKQIVNKLKLFQNFIYVENIPYYQVAYYTKNSDVGFWLLKEHVEKNISPNKIYENLICGNVIICRTGFKVSKMIEENEAGKQFDYSDNSNNEIINFIDLLEKDSDLLNKYKNNSKKLGKQFIWEKEECKYFNIYNRLKNE